jgi:hypothetical protein
MWFYDNYTAGRARGGWKFYSILVFNIVIIVSGVFIMVGGTYGSIVSIKDDYAASGGVRSSSNSVVCLSSAN